jgi:uncharacterized protein
MKINLEQIPEEGSEIKAREKVSLADGERIEVEMNLKVEKAAGEVFIRGDLSAKVALECSRCLNGFESVVNPSMDLVYTSAEQYEEDVKGHEVSRDELNLGFLSGEELDIGEIVAEQLILNIPMKPLCSDKCRGICQRCGKDLNDGDCGCETTSVDPRFQVLEKYLKQKEE